MVEEIITALSRMRWLFVIARNSSFTYKGRAVDVKQVGRELGVRYVLEGSVRKAGNRVRITGQLIDTATGAHLWADRFDGELDGHLRPAGPGDRERGRRDRAEAGAGRDRARQAQADREPRRLRLLPARHGRRSSLDPGGQRGGAAHCSTGRSSSTPTSPRPMAWRRAAISQRKASGWVTDRRAGDRRSRAAGAARGRAGQGRRGRARYAPGFALAYVVGDLDDGAALIDRALALNPEPGLGMALQRLGKDLARRAGGRDRARRARHAAQPARSSILQHADRHRGGPFLRRPLCRGVVLGGSGSTRPAGPYHRGMRGRGKRCARRAACGSTESRWRACVSSIPRCAFPISRI